MNCRLEDLGVVIFQEQPLDGAAAPSLFQQVVDYYVLGVVYDIPDEAISSLDKREGALRYRREDGFIVELGFEQVEVFAYTVVDKALQEKKPSADYFNMVCRGMVHRFPAEYVNRYLIDHGNGLGMQQRRIPGATH